mmetsp:Transcript_20568/g.44658  ORF Transcript_20568/g.44658 Transcript_20568/m.44658 type:complete len:93 (-) Transcript_20568:1141-1419(-)
MGRLIVEPVGVRSSAKRLRPANPNQLYNLHQPGDGCPIAYMNVTLIIIVDDDDDIRGRQLAPGGVATSYLEFVVPRVIIEGYRRHHIVNLPQ